MKRQRRSGAVDPPDLSLVQAAFEDCEPAPKVQPMINTPENLSPARESLSRTSPASVSPVRFNLESSHPDGVDRKPSQSDSIAIPSRVRSHTFDSGYGGTLSPAHMLGHVSHYHSDGHSMASPDEHFVLDLDDEPLTDDDDVFMDNTSDPFHHYMMGEEALISDEVEEEEPEEGNQEEEEDLDSEEDELDGPPVEQPEVPWLQKAAGQSLSTTAPPSTLPHTTAQSSTPAHTSVPGDASTSDSTAAPSFSQTATRPVTIAHPVGQSSVSQLCLSPHSPVRRSLMESAFCRSVPSPPSDEDYVLLPAITVKQTCTGRTQSMPAPNRPHSTQLPMSMGRDRRGRAPPVPPHLIAADRGTLMAQRSISVNTAPRDAPSRGRFYSDSDSVQARARLHSTPEEDHEDDETFVPPPPRDRSASMPACQNQVLVRQRFGQELRRISDEFNSFYMDRSGGSPSSFPGARRRRSWWEDLRGLFSTSQDIPQEDENEAEEPAVPVTFQTGPDDEDEVDGVFGQV